MEKFKEMELSFLRMKSNVDSLTAKKLQAEADLDKCEKSKRLLQENTEKALQEVEDMRARFESLTRQRDLLDEEVKVLRQQLMNLTQMAARTEMESHIHKEVKCQLESELGELKQQNQLFELHKTQFLAWLESRKSVSQNGVPPELDHRESRFSSFNLSGCEPPVCKLSETKLHDKRASNQLIHRFCAHRNPNSLLISAGEDGRVVILDADQPSASPIYNLSPHHSPGSVTAIDMNEDFSKVVCAWSGNSALDTVLTVVNMTNQRAGGTFRGHTARIVHCSFIDQGRLASAAMDRTLRLWDARRETCVRTLHSTSNIYAAATSSDRSLMATGHQNGSLKLVSVRGGGDAQEHLIVERVHSLPVTGCAFSESDPNYLCTIGRDNVVKLFDVRRMDFSGGSSLVTIDVSNYRTRDAYTQPSFCHARNMIAAPSSKGFTVWSSKTGAVLAQTSIEGAAGSGATTLSWIGNGLLAAGSASGVLSIWGPDCPNLNK
eukprot:GDKJ01039069.1.p1 GENE.GDKJ01039069.1~~GDKJ01039069.1.p1  ORF type:complete len:551 (-),score=113.75 GDKJ01039069.1:111-1583(-)